MTQIVLDAEAFKALSSDTRLQILKSLDARPLTVSELGRLLNLNKATVFEHLKQLAQADLVKKIDDEGRKWVYYKLTWKGKNVLHPENVQFMLLLGTAVLSVGGAIATMGRMLEWWGVSPLRNELGVRSPLLNRDSDGNGTAPQFSSQESADSAAGAQAPTQDSQKAADAPPSAPRDDLTASKDDEMGGGAQDGLNGPEDPAVIPESDDAFTFNDPQLWLIATLIVLVIVTVCLGIATIRERRRERGRLEARLAAKPAAADG